LPERVCRRLRRPCPDVADRFINDGEGKAYYKGELLDGKEALERAGIPVPGLHARDGLATINGSNVMTAMSAIFLHDANNWLKQAEIAAAMSLEALKANMKPYNIKLHQARGFSGAIRSAGAINKLISGGDLIEGKIKCKSRMLIPCGRPHR